MRLATTEEEKQAVYRFRYGVYVVEMGRYGEAADHEHRRLVEPEDETARIWYAAQDGEVVATHRLSAPGRYLGEVHQALSELAQNQFSALDGLSEDEAERVLGKSNIIRCSAGDRVLKQGGVARNMFVVLEGTFEVRVDDTLIRVFSPGDVFGEMAFLLERPRSADVYAATDGRILSLSEGTLRKAIGSDPEIAAQLLLNVSKMLCYRVLQSS